MLYPSVLMLFGLLMLAAAIRMTRRALPPARVFGWLALALALAGYTAASALFDQLSTMDQRSAWPFAAVVFIKSAGGSWHSSTFAVGWELTALLAALFTGAALMLRLQAAKGALPFARLARWCSVALLLPLIAIELFVLAAPFLFGNIAFEFAALPYKVIGIGASGLLALSGLALALLVGQLPVSFIRKLRMRGDAA